MSKTFETLAIKRLILRAVLRRANPMVIRLISVPDNLQLQQFHRIFHAILGWEDEGFQSIDRRLNESGPLQPERFSLSETNERLRALAPRQRVWA